MLTLRKICQKIDQFFQAHYPLIWFTTILLMIIIGFLHYELTQNGHDLTYWHDLFSYCYNELEHFALVLIMVIVVIKVVFLAFIIVVNSRSFSWFDDMTQLEVKKRYADFLFLRLISEIDRIDTKYMRNLKENEILTMKSFIMAHEEMRTTIESFRKDARKLLTPNEMEVSLPMEEVYGVIEDEERVVRRSRFYHMDISADDELIKTLVNP